jgi:uncharacterized membrane protein YsdA (DUF1294 family)
MLRAALVALGVLNLVTFLWFGYDKRRARKGGWRTPEAHLLLLSFFGGFPGGWFGMSVFRHKTRKLGFRVKMFLATLLSPVWLLLWWQIRV